MAVRKTKTVAKQRRGKRPARAGAYREDRITEMRRKMEEYAVVHDMAKALTSTLQLDQVLKTVM